MKILSIGNFSGRGWDGSITDENHIADALESLGHEVIRQQRDDPNLEYGGTINNGKEDTDPDFILIAQYDHYPEDMIKGLRVTFPTSKVVFWSFDYQEWGQPWCENLIASSDLYLSKRIADSKYPNWQWLSQDFAPEFLHKAEPITKDIDVLFTGSYLPWAAERNKTLKAVDEKFNLVIHSVNAWDGFNNVRPAILDEGLPELYARAKIILSIDHTIEAGYWSDRLAQIMCCGGFALQRYVPMMEVHFPEGEGFDYFYSKNDCLKKISKWLSPGEEQYREDIARYGYEFAQQNHKVINRVKDLLTIVNAYLHVRPV
jgi:hypothetical protein